MVRMCCFAATFTAPASDEPLVWYEGSGTGDRRFLHSDERGSVVALTDSSGAIIATNSYDEYGVPTSTNLGRFQYTVKTWLSELGMYYYKARIYWPTLGRFLQAAPIGYADGMNLYAYVDADPVNRIDPTGTTEFMSNRAYWIDNDDDWRPGRGPNLITMAGGHSRDGMGTWDIVRVVSGRVDVLAFDREQARTNYSFVAIKPPAKKPCVGGVCGTDKYNANTDPVILKLWADPEVRAMMKQAWANSGPNGGNTNEYGFWLKQQSDGNFMVGMMIQGRGGNIEGLRWRPDKSWDIFFHIHPFSNASGRISTRDMRTVNAGALVVAYAHGNNFYKYDGR